MAKCQAITSRRWTHQIEWVARCQNKAVITASGAQLCGTHARAIVRGDIEVIATAAKAEILES